MTRIYKVKDKKDDYCKTFYDRAEALTDAINHCITEGLFVNHILEGTEDDSLTIVYIDPDDNSPEEIAIYPIKI